MTAGLFAGMPEPAPKLGRVKNALEVTHERMRRSIDNLNARADYYTARTSEPDLEWDEWQRRKRGGRR